VKYDSVLKNSLGARFQPKSSIKRTDIWGSWSPNWGRNQLDADFFDTLMNSANFAFGISRKFATHKQRPSNRKDSPFE
jgi:hypothetical protein